ncbi:MAG: hypothetical protein KAR07_02685 [Spirochaetes bacterium]|nr:hypothetical protein [Spirochaetota bacterium]
MNIPLIKSLNRKWRVIIAWALFLTIFYLMIHFRVRSLREDNQRIKQNKEISLIVQSINAKILRVMNVTKTLASNTGLINVLRGNVSGGSLYIKSILNTIHNSIKADLVYLMNSQGTVLASTAHLGISLRGRNYKFRSYFKKAVMGIPNIYPALGVTTFKRGLYHAVPMYSLKNIIGVIVVKMGLKFIDRIFKVYKDSVFLVSPDGIVFASNNKEFLYKSIASLKTDILLKILKTRQFGGKKIEPLKFNLLNKEINKKNIQYYVINQPLSIKGWRVIKCDRKHLFFPLSDSQCFFTIFFSAVILVLVIIIWILANNISYRKKIEAELKLLKSFLELTVSERTEELKIINEKLVKEIHKKKKTESALIESQKQLEDINNSKDKFFSIIAHDLRNPISSILAFTYIMSIEDNKKSPEEILEMSKDLYSVVNNTAALLENLLSWARNQTGSLNYSPKSFYISPIIDEAIALVRNSANEKKIEIEVSMDRDVKVHADVDMIKTVMRNLITNGIKFTHPEGKVSIKIHKKENHIIIIIEDNGIGIEKNNLKNIFRIDSKLSTPGTNNERGTGLGLSLSKDFIDKCGGEIWVESEAGRGSRFFVKLPKA